MSRPAIILLIWLLLCATTVLAQGMLQVSPDGSRARIFNNTPYFIACEVISGGRGSYWELRPGQGSPWYHRIDAWRCWM